MTLSQRFKNLLISPSVTSRNWRSASSTTAAFRVRERVHRVRDYVSTARLYSSIFVRNYILGKSISSSAPPVLFLKASSSAQVPHAAFARSMRASNLIRTPLKATPLIVMLKNLSWVPFKRLLRSLNQMSIQVFLKLVHCNYQKVSVR